MGGRKDGGGLGEGGRKDSGGLRDGRRKGGEGLQEGKERLWKFEEVCGSVAEEWGELMSMEGWRGLQKI